MQRRVCHRLWKDLRIWPPFYVARHGLSFSSSSTRTFYKSHSEDIVRLGAYHASVRGTTTSRHGTPVSRKVATVRLSSSAATRTGLRDPSAIVSSFALPAAATSTVKELYHGLLERERASLAQAITLVESSHPEKHKQAQWLLTEVLAHQTRETERGVLRPSVRLGLSGPPGAGKSTLTEKLGLHLLEHGLRVAVLAVDPSSSRTGGSILGDKTRMVRLSREPDAYIRPSPSRGNLGGVTRSTNEAIILCEGAGYDVIIVETVGVGQSEVSVCDMVDVFTLIVPPAAGDELQGLKRGIMEQADMVVINKADGDLLPAARRIKAEYISALKLIRSTTPHWRPEVLMMSALHNQGVAELWGKVSDYCRKMEEVGVFEEKRRHQRKQWLWTHIDWQLEQRFKAHPKMADYLRAMEERVVEGGVAPGTACDHLLNHFFHSLHHQGDEDAP